MTRSGSALKCYGYGIGNCGSKKLALFGANTSPEQRRDGIRKPDVLIKIAERRWYVFGTPGGIWYKLRAESGCCKEFSFRP
jgi:hypothetical protein